MKNRKLHLAVSLSLIFLTVGFIWINSALSGQDSGAISDRVRQIMYKVLEFIRAPEELTVFLSEHVRKVAHAVEYAVIGFEFGFLWVGLGKGFQGLWNAWSSLLATAVFDETIQLFATDRGPQITDVLLDTASGTALILIVYIVAIIISCVKNERK